MLGNTVQLKERSIWMSWICLPFCSVPLPSHYYMWVLNVVSTTFELRRILKVYSSEEMPQRQPQSPNQTLISITNDTKSSRSFIPNDTKNKGWTTDNSPGIEALCTIYITNAVIISVGIFGNVILIKVLFKTKSMQMVPNIFITSLDFGDLLLLLTCVPVDATHYLAEGWLFGRIGCKVLSFIWVTSVGVSH